MRHDARHIILFRQVAKKCSLSGWSVIVLFIVLLAIILVAFLGIFDCFRLIYSKGRNLYLKMISVCKFSRMRFFW